ncbi:MAG: sugar ABC transporter permease [Bacteroides sp.]|nr:sugar ABC transporter permease [Prevotella sp.]MCM1407495.1 sugar ABC transporter permease [Treponema brennaborense]MCM1469985.1 sugar ABC transporter permease [Bacteroides sp.]
MKTKTFEQKKNKWGLFFTLPGLLFFSFFSFYPMINAFITSFYNRKLLSVGAAKFIGLKNYISTLASRDFWNSLYATLIFAVCCFAILTLGSLILAECILSRRKNKRVWQMLFYSPAVLSSVVSVIIWMLLFDPRGLANQFVNAVLGTVGTDHKWLASASMVRFVTVLIYVWKYIGFFTILFITGISKIPVAVYEAAVIDGASRMQQFWLITLPLLKPTTVMVSVTAMIQCLKTFSTQYLLTQSGAPLAPIHVITLNIYNTAMRDLAISRACVMSIILFLLILLLTLLQLRFSKSDEVSF